MYRPFALLLILVAATSSCGDSASPVSPPPPVANSPQPPTEPPPPAPRVTSISVSPSTAPAGSPDVTLTITGVGFTYHFTHVAWSPVNGQATALSGTTIDGSHLTAVVPASLLAVPGVATVSVRTLAPDDIPRPTYAPVTFTITQ